MPSKPLQATKLEAMNSADILNTILDENPSMGIQSRAVKPGDTLPDGRIATQADSVLSLRGIGEAINASSEFTATKNTFLGALVNRIGRVIITSRLYSNPWAMFKQGFLDYGETIEEIFVGLAKPYQFTPVGTEQDENPYKIFLPDVKAAFHSLNFRKYYPTTVTNDDLRTAFLSWEGITDLIARIIEQIYAGANYDEFLIMKYMIARLALDGQIASVTIPTVTAANARTVTADMVTYARNLGFMSTDYNRAGVETYTDPSWLYMILTTDISAILDVEVLALSFNMSRAELIGQQIFVDGFGTFNQSRLAALFKDDPYTTYTPFTSAELNLLGTIKGLLCDKRWFMIYDNYMEMTDKYNPRQLYWNYFYHVWKTFSTSPFANALMFTTTSSTVSGVSISPDSLTMNKGTSKQLTATVSGTGFVNQAVHWEVSGTEEFTTISDQGVLTVGAGETATSVTVKATSIQDSTESDTLAVTIA